MGYRGSEASFSLSNYNWLQVNYNASIDPSTIFKESMPVLKILGNSLI
jgi:hypothetical protein